MEKIENYKPSFFNLWKEKDDKKYLINTYKRKVVEFEEGEVDFIKKLIEGNSDIKKDERYSKYMEELKNLGYIINADFDEHNSLEYKYNQSYFNDDTTVMALLPTMRCNFVCPYCFESEKEMTWNDEQIESLKKLGDKNFKYKKFVYLVLFGGEPLLEWEKIKELLDYYLELKNKYGFHFMTGIGTNTFLMNEEVIKSLIDKYYCKYFEITVGGTKKSHDETRILKDGSGTFDIIMDNFKKLLFKIKSKSLEERKTINVGLRVNLIDTKPEEIHPLLDLFGDDDKKYFHIKFRPVHKTKEYHVDNSKVNENLEQFYDEIEKRNFIFHKYPSRNNSYCDIDGGRNKFMVLPDLTLWKCMEDIKVDNSAKFGYVDANGEIIVDQMKLEKWSRKSPFKNNACMKCIYLPICYGGCPLKYSMNNKNQCFPEKKFDLTDFFLSWGYKTGL